LKSISRKSLDKFEAKARPVLLWLNEFDYSDDRKAASATRRRISGRCATKARQQKPQLQGIASTTNNSDR
jgi:hypothetical protein